MANTRHKDGNWQVGDERTGDIFGWSAAQVAVLMDIRDELKEMNETLRRVRSNTSVLQCTNAIAIPDILRRIEAQAILTAKNTTKAKRRRKAAKK